MKSLGIVIPSFNELESLKVLVPTCIELLAENLNLQVVVVDNGSNDGTKLYLETYSNIERFKYLVLEANQGYGGGIVAGLNQLDTEYLSWTHADLQTDIFDIFKFDLNSLPDYFLAKGIRRGRSLSDYIFTFGMTFFVLLKFRTLCNDINGQPTIISRKLYNKFSCPPNDFSFDLYAFIMAKKMKSTIIRNKVNFSNRKYSHSKWNFGFTSKINMTIRTLKFSNSLKRYFND